jgi:hypothetical protein
MSDGEDTWSFISCRARGSHRRKLWSSGKTLPGHDDAGRRFEVRLTVVTVTRLGPD